MDKLLIGVVVAVLYWYVKTRYGDRLKEFWELRSETQRQLLGYENCRPLAAQLHAFIDAGPGPLVWMLHWPYDLKKAASSLDELSNAIVGGRDDDITAYRVQAQRALRLRSDPRDLQTVEDIELLKRITLADLDAATVLP